MKKRIIALLVCAFMLLSFAACGEKTKTETDAETTVQDISDSKEETKEAEAEETEEKTETVFGDFISKDIEGNEVSAEVFKGKKVTMVNIWATFCSPCIGEMPDLEKLGKDYADKDFQVVGIVCDAYNDELLSQAKDIIEQTGVTYLNIVPSESLNEAKLNDVMSVPETIFLDENGEQIGESFIGSRSYEQWAEIIESVIESAQ